MVMAATAALNIVFMHRMKERKERNPVRNQAKSPARKIRRTRKAKERKARETMM